MNIYKYTCKHGSFFLFLLVKKKKMMMMMDGFSAGHDGAHTNEGEGPPVK